MKRKSETRTPAASPPAADHQAERLARLAALPDDTIDTSDSPELSEQAWDGAVRGRFYRPVKQQITARVDADVVDWLKSGGKGYQSRLNAILRREMLAALKQTRRA